jgi:flagellar protein FliO/FliZ
MSFRVSVTVLLLFVVGFSVGYSPSSFSETQPIGSPSTSILGTGGQVLLVLGLVIALLFLLTWFLKRSGLAHQAANGHLKVLGGVSVGPRERVLLLQVGQEQILVGVTSAEITLLHMLSHPVNVDELKQESLTSGFAQQLQAVIRRRSESS